eukprot:s1078_g10.t1
MHASYFSSGNLDDLRKFYCSTATHCPGHCSGLQPRAAELSLLLFASSLVKALPAAIHNPQRLRKMAEAADAPQHIQLKVKDQQGSEVQFKIKKTTPLRKLMDAYCSRLGLQASQVRFMVDGERIAADDTAEKLGLEDEDLIDVAMEQTGGR